MSDSHCDERVWRRCSERKQNIAARTAENQRSTAKPNFWHARSQTTFFGWMSGTCETGTNQCQTSSFRQCSCWGCKWHFLKRNDQLEIHRFQNSSHWTFSKELEFYVYILRVQSGSHGNRFAAFTNSTRAIQALQPCRAWIIAAQVNAKLLPRFCFRRSINREVRNLVAPKNSVQHVSAVFSSLNRRLGFGLRIETWFWPSCVVKVSSRRTAKQNTSCRNWIIWAQLKQKCRLFADAAYKWRKTACPAVQLTARD